VTERFVKLHEEAIIMGQKAGLSGEQIFELWHSFEESAKTYIVQSIRKNASN
jgi:hypothetical protein